jgi:hypothetical protein
VKRVKRNFSIRGFGKEHWTKTNIITIVFLSDEMELKTPYDNCIEFFNVLD